LGMTSPIHEVGVPDLPHYMAIGCMSMREDQMPGHHDATVGLISWLRSGQDQADLYCCRWYPGGAILPLSVAAPPGGGFSKVTRGYGGHRRSVAASVWSAGGDDPTLRTAVVWPHWASHSLCAYIYVHSFAIHWPLNPVPYVGQRRRRTGLTLGVQDEGRAVPRMRPEGREAREEEPPGPGSRTGGGGGRQYETGAN